MSSPFHSFLFGNGCSRLSQSLLYCLLCLLFRFRFRLFFSSMLKGRLLAPIKIITVLSPFLLDVQRKVIGACQNRLLVSISSPFHSFLFVKRSCWLSIFTLLSFYCICWFRSRLLFSCNFHERSWRLIIVCSFLSGLLITHFCLKNVLGGCLLLYTVVTVFYLISCSLLYRQWNVLCDCLNLLERS
jgi:hypothetical protein